MNNQTNALMKANLGDTVSYSSGNFQVGGAKLNAGLWDSCWHDYNHYYPQTYPVYINSTVVQKPNAFELAFKIVTKMLETKVIEKLTVKQLIETVNEIAKLV